MSIYFSPCFGQCFNSMGRKLSAIKQQQTKLAYNLNKLNKFKLVRRQYAILVGRQLIKKVKKSRNKMKLIYPIHTLPIMGIKIAFLLVFFST